MTTIPEAVIKPDESTTGSDTFEWAPISEHIQMMRDKRDAFTQGKLIKINTERTKIYTDYYRAHPSQHPLLKRSGAVLYWAQQHETNVFDDDIFVGTPGPDERSLGFYVDNDVEWLRDTIDPETFEKAWQSDGAIKMTDEQRDILVDAYEVWKDITISKLFEGALTDDFYPAFGTGPSMNGLNAFAGVAGIRAMPQGHYTANFGKAVNYGFGEVRRQALEKIEETKGKLFGDENKKHLFYYAVVNVCDAAILLAKRYAQSCRDKADGCTDATRKAELMQMADSLDWIMEHPARTYWEGLQAIVLYQLLLTADAQQHGQSMGRVDKYVGHLLEKQLADGSLTRERAQELTDAFILRLCDIMIVPGSKLQNKKVIELNESGMNAFMAIYNGMTATGGIVLTLGGSNVDGEDESNEATKMLLQSYGRLKIPDPTVALRVNPNTPDDVWRLGIESSKLTGGMPEILNDEIVIPTMIKWGFTPEDAADYTIVGCVEPGGNGNEWSASGNNGCDSIWDMCEALQLMINGGICDRSGKMSVPVPKLYEYKSFEEMQEAYAKLLDYCLSWTVSYASIFELVYSQNFPAVVASTLMDGCLESGKDATEGGAKYNRTGLTGCGTANIADSFMAIKKLCFDEKSVTLQEFYDALQANWEGYEQLRQRIINEVPHYGNDIEEVDELANWALGLFADTIAEKHGPRGQYGGGTFTMMSHLRFGAGLAATPDGRKAGEPIADAISPRQGFDKNGPTAYLRSAAKLPHDRLVNGDQLNIRFTPSSVRGDEGARKLRQLISTYFKLGGMQVQFNVVGTEQLYEAQEKPLENKDLIVRIAGFSTYFVTLDKNAQDDFITRTEQSI